MSDSELDSELFPVPPGFAARAHIDEAAYAALYRRSLEEPEGFWREQAGFLDWIKPFPEVRDTHFDPVEPRIRWYADGTLNASVNCLAGTCRPRRSSRPSCGRATIRTSRAA